MKLMVALSALAATPMVLSATAAPWAVSLAWWTGVRLLEKQGGKSGHWVAPTAA